MSALGDRGITLEGLAAAVDALRQELATWKALAHKQDQLTADQITATQSGATAAKISQIAVNTAAIQSLAAQVAGQISLEYVTTLPATGEPLTLYLVPQGDGTAPNYCDEYLWINNAWELIGTTGAMANNGELTIQVNGVAVGTFTANQATNATINVAVPTNTNQLVNGAGFVDAAALQAALLLKQNSLNATQLEAVNSGITAAAVQQIADNATAIAGKQDALTTAQQAAVDSGATAAKIDQIAANASAIVSLTSSKQDALSTTQLAAVNSGVTAAAVQQIGTNASNISGLQTAVASKAADDAVVHLAGAETITGDKTFTGSVVTHNITPETNGTYNLGSTSYQWASVYAQTYYYNGIQWGLDKANVWSQSQTIKAAPPVLYLQSTSIQRGVAPASDSNIILYGRDLNNTELCRLLYRASSTGERRLWLGVNDNYLNGALDPAGNSTWNSLDLYLRADGKAETTCQANFMPASNNAYNLGTSSNKWKTLNGVNPGALSIPNLSANSRVDISASIVADSYGNIKFTPQIYGWVYIDFNVTSATITSGTVMYAQAKNNNLANTGFAINFMRPANSNHIFVWMPVWENKQIIIEVNFSGFSVGKAYIYPCLGNV